MNTPNVQEGYLPVTGGRVWYRIVGSGSAIPLLTLHGGPGVPHDYLEPLEALVDERPIIFYDQLGCGKSDRPDDSSLWRIPRFVEELRQLQQALQLKQVHLLGHSWGTILATEFALTKPVGLVSRVLASPSMSHARIVQDVMRLCAEFPKEVQSVIKNQLTGNGMETDAPLLAEVEQEYNRRHGCRLDPVPEALLRAIAGIGQQVLQTMRGGNSGFSLGGELGDYDASVRLHEITIPTLLTCGRYDDSTPETTAWYQNLIPGAEMVVFEQGSHMHLLEEPEHYCQVVRDFLHRV
ncbi:MAG: proline iminopeptidase-family hydrolase [Caldilineaceae bacterium]